jgi:hypothetical protein
MVLLSACEDPAGLGPTDEPDLARQVGNAIHGYEAPTLALDGQDGIVEVCAAWSDEALFKQVDPEFYSFTFSIRSHDDPPGEDWVDLESVRGDDTGAAACLRISREQVEMAAAGRDEDEAWLRVKGMARAGKGRNTTVHHTEYAHLLVSDLKEGEGPGGDDGERSWRDRRPPIWARREASSPWRIPMAGSGLALSCPGAPCRRR